MELTPNQRAFLALIAFSEGTDRNGTEGYRICYGYRHTIADLSEHPAITGEWRGEKLSDQMCRDAGQQPGCVSTAAGRYQIIKPTWVSCRNELRLPDFGPQSQDRAALLLCARRGATDDILAGRVAAAVAKVRKEWASLPGAGYNQPERRIGALVAVFERAGGVLTV